MWIIYVWLRNHGDITIYQDHNKNKMSTDISHDQFSDEAATLKGLKNPQYLSLGNSSLKSRHTRGEHSLRARIFATISFPCHFPRHISPEGLTAILVWRANSLILMPLCLERVGSPAKNNHVRQSKDFIFIHQTCFINQKKKESACPINLTGAL